MRQEERVSMQKEIGRRPAVKAEIKAVANETGTTQERIKRGELTERALDALKARLDVLSGRMFLIDNTYPEVLVNSCDDRKLRVAYEVAMDRKKLGIRARCEATAELDEEKRFEERLRINVGINEKNHEKLPCEQTARELAKSRASLDVAVSRVELAERHVAETREAERLALEELAAVKLRMIQS